METNQPLGTVNVTYTVKRKIPIVKIEGHLTMATLSQVNEVVTPLLAEVKSSFKIPGFIIDFQGLKVIDSSGIGWITGKHVGLKKLEKRMFFCDIPASIAEILNNVKVLNLLNEASVLDALEALAHRVPD